ncbi:mannan endo-1,4-beta-mannosidase 1 [Canna indica]|uniref:mannan endo-1,4-beta-mannosidase n=1 Tax=Canna indica TaxID=4628 RepID=A0AAQ3LBL4_9LILI|nr:mannan endo-1,4-beta-mannosidase 1 [Canna indica]
MEKMRHLFPLILLPLLLLSPHSHVEAAKGFIKTRGLNFVLNGNPFFAHGFNAYWLMTLATDPSQRSKVSSAFRDASGHGLLVARTWAFSDGGFNALQYSPGHYNEQTFKGLDFVISEARKYGIRLILSLSNNYATFGGKKQYVQWARNQGQYIALDDGFFTNPVCQGYYKNHVKTVLTRVNTITRIAYKNDPTIFAWELMNEPRCQSDLSGHTIQEWIREMAAYVKSIDNKHLLEVGLEGFYGSSSPHKQFNPSSQVGTDFIANNLIPNVDFATIHSYPDQWLSNSNDRFQLVFLSKWIDIHLQDSKSIIGKPLLITEFGKSWRDSGFSIHQRDALFNTVYDKIYWSARTGGSAAGGFFWQLLSAGMDSYRDGYEVILSEATSTSRTIALHSRQLRRLGKVHRKK